ncbi:MAG: hypothetical protein AAGA54_02250 [Myxococcota bacterium]
MSLALPLLLLLPTIRPPAPAVVDPPCGLQLRQVRDAERTLRTLQRSEARVRARVAQGEANLVEPVLVPIATQARALEREVDARARRYIRCIESAVTADAQADAQ